MKDRPQGNMVIRIIHDEDATVFLNGTEIAKLPGHTGNYALIELSEKAADALKPGRNVLAIHVKQTAGGQFIDAGLMDETVTK